MIFAVTPRDVLGVVMLAGLGASLVAFFAWVAIEHAITAARMWWNRRRK